ncbi:MAG: hypothetical protein Q8S84_01530 [bacterium]|nr:hypothetical protein [bacterium]MDP3380248.1 hypothetical protein [bacterium]
MLHDITFDFNLSLLLLNNSFCHSSIILETVDSKSSIEITTFSLVILDETTQLLLSISLSQHSTLIGYHDNSKSVIFSHNLTFL